MKKEDKGLRNIEAKYVILESTFWGLEWITIGINTPKTIIVASLTFDRFIMIH